MQKELHKKANASSVDWQITKVTRNQDELKDSVRVLQNHCRGLESRLESLLNSRLDGQGMNQEPRITSCKKRETSSKSTRQTNKKQRRSRDANKVKPGMVISNCIAVPSSLTIRKQILSFKQLGSIQLEGSPANEVKSETLSLIASPLFVSIVHT